MLFVELLLLNLLLAFPVGQVGGVESLSPQECPHLSVRLGAQRTVPWSVQFCACWRMLPLYFWVKVLRFARCWTSGSGMTLVSGMSLDSDAAGLGVVSGAVDTCTVLWFCQG